LPATTVDPPSQSTRKRTPKSSARKSAPATVTYTSAQQQLDDALRAWRKSEAAKTGKPAFIVLSDAVIRNLAIAQPQSIPELLTVSGIGPEKAERLGADIVAISRRDAVLDTPATPAPTINQRTASPRPARERTTHPKEAAEKSPLTSRDSTHSSDASAPTFHRTRPTDSDPTADLTPEQQLLDGRLRAWRRAESARIGLPQFFILGSSALRSIVLLRPRTVAQLRTISGIGPDKIEKFGNSILEICSMKISNP
jgi:ATP-dependent DNA helicase RecQ